MVYVGIDIEGFVIEHGGGEFHHLGEDKEVLEVVSDLFRDELDKIRD